MAALHRPALPAPRIFRKPRPGRLVVTGALALVVVAAGFQVNQFSRLTSTGYQIDELGSQRSERQAANHALEAEVAQLSSLARVDWEARTRLHLEPAQQTLYITVNHAVPDRQTLPTRFLPAEAPDAGQAANPMWKRLLKALPFF
jgi:cell division protein FtsL